MEFDPSMERAMSLLPAIRSILNDAVPTTAGRERTMAALNERLYQLPSYQRLPQRVKMFIGGYIFRGLEETYGQVDVASD